MTNPDILSAYSLPLKNCHWQKLSGGLINATWKITCSDKAYILQRINTNIFKTPELVAQNLELLSKYLSVFPEYLFVAPIHNSTGQNFTTNEEGHFRLFPFIEQSYTIQKVSSPSEAFEAAAQFGKFTWMLRDFDAEKLNVTLPDFHNLTLRYNRFLEATEKGNSKRIRQSATLINELKSFVGITEEFERIKTDKSFFNRVTHHDTKISNVLYDRNGKGLCVIDLDTVMPGYFFSDVGDMIRTYLSPVTEEETDLSKITIRTDIFEAIVSGYLKYTNDMLTDAEKNHIFYAGTFLIYMQALRFITDFLNNDVYYGATYPDHNFNRAANQLVLLQELIKKEHLLKEITSRYIN
jgi:hypothetical protein